MDILLPNCILEHDLYPVSNRLVPVNFTTKRLAQGWVCRYLTPNELGLLFGYEITLLPQSLPSLVPCDMLIKILSVLQLAPDQATTTEILQPQRIPTIHVDQGFTWIPHLKQKLPHWWCNSAEQTSTLVKHNNATILTSIWDSRITHLFPPFTSDVLTLIREKMICYSKRRLL